MLKIEGIAARQLVEALHFALAQDGPEVAESLAGVLHYLDHYCDGDLSQKYGNGTVCELFPDWSAHSFGFAVTKADGNQIISGLMHFDSNTKTWACCT